MICIDFSRDFVYITSMKTRHSAKVTDGSLTPDVIRTEGLVERKLTHSEPRFQAAQNAAYITPDRTGTHFLRCERSKYSQQNEGGNLQ